MRIFLIITFVLFACFSIGYWSDSHALSLYEITASIDVKSMELDGEAKLVVTVSAPDGVSIPIPLKPNVEGLNFELDRESVEFKSVVRGSSIMSVKVFPYHVSATMSGNYVIPPFVVMANQQKYHSSSLKLIVLDPNQSKGQNTQTQTTQQQASTSNIFWLTASINQNHAYQNEQVIYTVRLQTRESLEMEGITLPDLSSFWVVELVPEKRGSVLINGVQHLTYEKVFALFPIKTGELIIEPAAMEIKYTTHGSSKSGGGNMGPFSYSWNTNRPVTKKEILKSDSLAIRVDELPKPVPADFTGLVGNFGWQVQLNPLSANVGDSVTFDIKISGYGNVRNAELPKMDLKSFKVYNDKPITDEIKTVHGLSGSKSFKYALIPQIPGTYDFKNILTASYFDPQKGDYTKFSDANAAMELMISGSTSTETETVITTPDNITTQNGINKFWEADLVDLSTDDKSRVPKYLVFIIVIPPVTVSVLLLLFVLRKLSGVARNKNQGIKRARRILIKSLRSAHASASVLEAIRNYFSHITGIAAEAVTAHEIDTCLKDIVSVDVRHRFVKAVTGLEGAAYGATSDIIIDIEPELLATLFEACEKKYVLRNQLPHVCLIVFVFYAALFHCHDAAAADEDKLVSEAAQMSYKTGNYAEALEKYELLENKHPLSLAIKNNLIILYQLQNMPTKARVKLEQALVLSPRNPVLNDMAKMMATEKRTKNYPAYIANVDLAFPLMRFITLTEACYLTSGVALFWAVITFSIYVRRRKIFTVATAFVLMFYFYLTAGMFFSSDAYRRTGTLISDKVSARDVFFSDGSEVFLLSEGDVVLVEAVHAPQPDNKWYFVRNDQGKMGWVSAQDVWLRMSE